MQAVYVDAEAAVRAWINARTDLVGQGRAIPNGAHLRPLRSPNRGAYLWLQRVGGTGDLTAEQPIDRARISAQIYGGTLEAASVAATAYANALATVNGAPVPMGAARCLVVDQITGPVRIDDHDTGGEQFRYLVDADFLLTAA